MSVSIPRFEDGIPLAPGMPEVSDIGDVWLVHALASLLDACGVAEGRRAKLVASGTDSFKPRKPKRVDVRRCNASGTSRFLPACRRVRRPRGRGPPEPRPPGRETRRMAHDRADVGTREVHPRIAAARQTRARARSKGALPTRGRAVRGPRRARRRQRRAALRCSGSARAGHGRSSRAPRGSARSSRLLADESESETARLAHRAAEALERRADALALVKSASSPCPEPSGEVDFPPDIAEW